MNAIGHLSLPSLTIVLTIKVLILLTAILTLTWFMRRSSAAVRHLFLSAAVLLLLALPVTSLISPSWNIGMFTDPFTTQEGQTLKNASHAGSFTTMETGTSTPQPGSLSSVKEHGYNWFDWLLIIWITGAAILLVRLLGGKLYGYLTARKAPEIKNSDYLDTIKGVARQFGLNRDISIFESDRFKVPFVSGIFKPRLILPSFTGKWPRDRLKAILVHELAHIKRKDIFVQFLAQVACCIYWFIPLVWVLERRLFLERERACDDMALHQNIKASEYAGHLMEVLEEMGNKTSNLWVVTAMAEGTDFKDRILSILNPTARRSSPKRVYTYAVIAMTFVLLLPLSAFSPWTGADRTDEVSTMEIVSPDSRKSYENKLVDERYPKVEKEADELDELLKSLKSPSAELRKSAVCALGELGDRRAVPALIKALKDESAYVREHAATALSKIEDARAVEPLIETLNDDDALVREHVATALGHLGDKRAVQPLLASLNDENAVVREHAATALRYLGDKQAIQALIDRLKKESNDEVRSHIIKAIQSLRSGRR